MELMPISIVSRKFNVSTRTLRYYEQMGLLRSTKKDEYAYRTYDDAAIKRLRQILILRSLRISLKQIGLLLENNNAVTAVDVFTQSLNEISDEITALSAIRSVLQALIARLKDAAGVSFDPDILKEGTMLKIIDSLNNAKINFKEERSMDLNELNKAAESLLKLKNPRIVYLPPFTVASSLYVGENPEEVSGKMLEDFVRSSGLADVKPDIRVFGFNNPCPANSGETYGYEFWVTVPDDAEVPEPLAKKHFQGGLYAAHCIRMGDFHEWKLLSDWANNNGDYEYDLREPLSMDGCLEEHLNAFTYYTAKKDKACYKQVDLLIPVKEKDQ